MSDPPPSPKGMEEDEGKGMKRKNDGSVVLLPTEETQVTTNNQEVRQQDGDVQMQDVAVASPNKFNDDKANMEGLNQIRQPLPNFDELAKAVDVFANPCFYENDMFCNLYGNHREKILGDNTIKHVFEEYTKGRTDRDGIESGLKSFGMAIGALEAPLLEYFRRINDNVSVEDILAKKEHIALSGDKDLKIFKKIVAQALPTTEELRVATLTKENSENALKRALDLALVIGSSGSGKTFFALQDLATSFVLPTWNKEQPNGKNVTLHIYPYLTGVQFFMDNKEVNPQAATDLCKWIKESIWAHLKKEVHDEYKFKMHLCIIFDEAGHLDVLKWFENKRMLQKLCEQAALLAESVAVVVVGTALTGQELSSKDDAYVFRMKAWDSHDFRRILANRAPRLSEVKGLSEFEKAEVIERVTDAVFAHPKLGALATNARSAYYLSESLAKLSDRYGSIVWRRQLDMWAPTLVAEVVDNYTTANGLRSLSKSQRRLVAASVFYALEESVKDRMELPTFDALQDKEIAVAHALLQYNLEHGKDKLTFVGSEKYAVTVTPAIAIVLYTIAGIQTTMMPGWKAEEMLAALYSTRQLLCTSMESFLNEIKVYRDESKESMKVKSAALERLNQSLENIELLALYTQVKAKPDTNGNIYIPMVGASTVMLNGDKAPFADVIAPYTLIQTKQVTSESNKKPIDVLEELRKCSLLQKQQDIRVLQGLVKMWRGELGPDPRSVANGSPRTTDLDPRSSATFPENLLCLAPPADQCSFAIIEQGDDVISYGGGKHPLPNIDEVRPAITFMFSTNLDEVRLQLPKSKVITISENKLDKEMTIDPMQLSIADQTAWTSFLRDRVRNGIQIKFLFTKSMGLVKR